VDLRRGLTRTPTRIRLRVALVGTLAGALTLASVAHAQPAPAPGSTDPRIEISESLPGRPDGYALGAREAIRIANRDPDVQETRDRWGKLEVVAEAQPPTTWKVSYFAGDEERAQVLVDDPTATVRESWTGYQVAWQMARGYEGSFGHLLNAWYVWIPLSALFLFGLFDFRHPRRIVHLDLLVLLSFSISHVFFNEANIGVSVPLAYPPLVYLLGRMLWIGFRGPGRGLRPTAPVAWLAIATCFLLGFRIALNVADSGVIDVGYSGVVGADRVVHGEPLYGEDAFPDDNPFGDTYGPVNYYFYVPFELMFGWDGEWDELPAAHAAALFFDLLAVGLLFLLGRRLRPGRPGTDLGVILAFAWSAYPYTAYTLQSNANDTLIGALVVGALLAIGFPLARGAMAAVAGLAKLAPLALIPLLAAGPRAGLTSLDPSTGDGPLFPARVRQLALFALGLAGAGALVLVQTLLEPGISTFFERTISNQVDRDSPFSIWGQAPSLDWLQLGVQIAAGALAILVAFAPRRRTLPHVAALAAAVLIAVQLTADHWFYLYIVWFLPATLAALGADRGAPRRREELTIRPGRIVSSGHRRPVPSRA
jgi:hypothetical protein